MPYTKDWVGCSIRKTMFFSGLIMQNRVFITEIVAPGGPRAVWSYVFSVKKTVLPHLSDEKH